MEKSEKSKGLLSFDFLAGFTIFIISVVMVANFVPSLLIGLQRSRSIDYDAVAYRTGVILVEDPGQIKVSFLQNGFNEIEGIGNESAFPGQNISWDRHPSNEIDRLGLAVTRREPNILSINKINRFFCTTVSLGGFDDRFDSPTNDYRSKLLFSTYPYEFNITLQNISPMKPGNQPMLMSVGTGPYPTAGYGYIRRYVAIKQNPYVDLDFSKDARFITDLAHADETFRVHLDGSKLYNLGIDIPYILDPQTEPLIINLSHFVRTGYTSARFIGINIMDQDGLFDISDRVPHSITYDSNNQFDGTPAVVRDNVNLTANINTFWVSRTSQQVTDLYIIFKFADPPDQNGNPDPHTLIGNTLEYDYNSANVARPDLVTGVLEVGIW